VSARNVRLLGDPLVHGCNAPNAPTYCRKATDKASQTGEKITCPKCLDQMKIQAAGSQAAIDALKKWAGSSPKR